jgi:hypothetical protein
VNRQPNTDALERYVRATNAREPIDWYFATDYVYHGPTGDLDRAGFLRQHDGFLAAFPDVTVTIEDIVADGDRTVTRWSAIGTHRGELMGTPPGGRAVRVTGIVITRFAGGQAAEEWEEMDLLGLMRHIGALPGATP